MNLLIGKILSHMWLFRCLFINWNIYDWDYYEWEIKLDVKKTWPNDDVARKCLKLIRSFFSYHTKKFRRQSFINWTTKSRVIHVRFSIPWQYQMMMSSVVWVKFIKTNIISRSHKKGVWNQVSSNSDHKIKSYSCSDSSIKIPVSRWEKMKKWGKNLGYITGQ